MERRRIKRVVALILGGGQGNRLFPLTMYRSKPAVPIGGKYRLIDVPISNCLHSNIKDIYVLTQFNSESLNNHINNTYRFDYFSRAFVRILAAEQTLANTNWYEGTADAVRKNITHLELKGDEDVIILSGDHVYDMDYRDLLSFHRKNKADFTVSVVPVNDSGVEDFGILKLGGDDKISGFKEKPTSASDLKEFKFRRKISTYNGPLRAPSYLASMGVYVFNASALLEVLDGNDADFGKEVIPHSIKKLKGYGYVFTGYWKDVGTIKSFYDANIEMASNKAHFSFFYKGLVFTRPRFLPTARIHNSVLENVLITEGSFISDADIKNSVVGLRAIIGKRCKVSRAVIMGSDYYEGDNSGEPIRIGIGDGSIIEDAIIDKNARIGKNVVIRNSKRLKDHDGTNYFIRDGIVIIPKNAVVKDNFRI